MQAFIDEDEVLQARIAELYKDKTLTDDNRVQRLADLINERGVELALSQRSKSMKQGQSQKRKRNTTKSPLMSVMKTYLKNQGFYKPHQLRGKSYDEIAHLYYHCKRYIEEKFIPMGTEETASKKQKIIEDKHAEKKNDSQRNEDNSSLDQMMVIVPETLYADPIQSRYPIID